ncbi:exported protein of unknown function [Rhodovastum atsumiense]|uniref:hypothetical protein n=1 Tax=Rhodovastum atsumiense TaxID=504468 RepID=UPI00139F2C23|nr:hypothetical protein [Rhodovastum atsumiense]CAH2604021.1 exported protein of unknown function [Rhodovastum atsumiense]
MRILVRAALLAALTLPAAACISYHEEPRKPAPVVVTPPPDAGPVVVTPPAR